MISFITNEKMKNKTAESCQSTEADSSALPDILRGKYDSVIILVHFYRTFGYLPYKSLSWSQAS